MTEAAPAPPSGPAPPPGPASAPAPAPSLQELPTEVLRLNKIIRALMARSERSASVTVSDFGLFQSTIMLEEQIRRRTVELEDALRDNEKITRSLSESEAMFHMLVNQSMVGIVIIENGKFSYTNAKYREIFGYSEEECRALGPVDTVVDKDRALVTESLRKRLSGETAHDHYVCQCLRKDGGVIDTECNGSGMRVGGKFLLISLIMDITDRTRSEHEVLALQERLRDQSTHDSLTGLYNRRYLEDTLGRELIRAAREGTPLSVIMSDLDHFKAVNDLHGHLAGDEVLRTYGALMRSQARGSDIYCRYGGEEFLLVLPTMPQESAVVRAEQLRSAIAAAPVTYGASSITVTASFGVASFPRSGRTGDELIAAADAALYAAKAAGRNRVNIDALPVRP